MSADQHQAALRAYEEALTDLYGTPTEARVAAAADFDGLPVADEARAQAVAQAAQALTESTATLLESADPLVRESGEVRLAALAARDFATAYDLARLDEEDGSELAAVDTPGAVLPQIEEELAFVLEGNPADGVPPSGGGWDGLATLASDGSDGRKTLRDGLTKALYTVRDDATELVVDGIGRIVDTGLDDALGKLLSGLAEHFPGRIKRWYRWAVHLFTEGVKKLRALFGKAFDAFIQKVGEWLKDHGPRALADAVYGVPALEQRLIGLVNDAPEGKDFAAAGASVQTVVDKHVTQKKVILMVFKGLSFTKRWILRVISPPTGEAVVGGAFLLGSSYALFSGGDYIDWERTQDEGFFDFVKGIRQTAEEMLA